MNALTEITLCSMCSQSPLVEVFKKKCGAIYIAQSMIALFEMGKIVREKINLGILNQSAVGMNISVDPLRAVAV